MKRSKFFSFVMVLTLLTGWIGSVSAQCGASLSSCKTCHEVKRAKPVATNGKWHQDHAFGDFCDFCHEGNTAALTADAAHEGIKTMPLKNAGNACSSCHPEDFKARAEKYAKLLHINLEGLAVENGNSTSQAPQEAASSLKQESKTPVETMTHPEISIPGGGEVIDFNQQLEFNGEKDKQIGNVILTALIALVFIGFLVMYFTFNRKSILEKIKVLGDMNDGSEKAISPNMDNMSSKNLRESEHEALISRLSESPHLAEAIQTIVNSGSAGEKVLTTLSSLDLNLLESIKKMSDKDLELLRSLAKKM